MAEIAGGRWGVLRGWTHRRGAVGGASWVSGRARLRRGAGAFCVGAVHALEFLRFARVLFAGAAVIACAQVETARMKGGSSIARPVWSHGSCA